ncbi:MAG: YfcE family phosphodiesterase [Planctomycetes bacterium]|nr:YfcE family phosphodiesterase [Planctomycetota bacterium]
MRLLVISDIHARMEMIGRLMAVDMTDMDCIVIAGDITHFGGYVEAAAVLEPIIKTKIPIVAVAGNCDTDGVEEYLAEKKISLQGHYLQQGKVIFVGVGGSLPCPKTTPGEYGDNVLETALSRAVRQAGESSGGQEEGSLIVVTHQPAFGTKVDSVGERYTGSAAIRRFIEIYQPVLAVSGHIHEAPGMDRIGKTTLVNPGPLKEGRYAVVELQAAAVNVILRQL